MTRARSELIQKLSGGGGGMDSSFAVADLQRNIDCPASTNAGNFGGASGWKVHLFLRTVGGQRLRWNPGALLRETLSSASPARIQTAPSGKAIHLSIAGRSSNGRAWYRRHRRAGMPHLHGRKVAARPGLFPSARIDTSNRTASHRKA